MKTSTALHKNVIISGAGGGAGRVIALRFADAGARVAICDVCDDAIADLRAADSRIIAVKADASNPHEVVEFFKMAEDAHGPVNILVNNVGMAGTTARVEDIGLEEWNTTLAVNLTSHFLFIREAVPAMKRQGWGSITNISSASTKSGLPMRLPYVVSKGAVNSMTETLARELGAYQIRVNAIMPGAIRGDRMARVIRTKAAALNVEPEEYEKTLLRYISLNTMVDAEDLAQMTIFLASRAGARITGQIIGVDGGFCFEE